MPSQMIRRGADGHSTISDPTFVQQGEVDWVKLSDAVVSMTVGSLRRLSSAGVQEITYVGALQLATRFKLPEIGYQRIENALNSLQYASALAKGVYFGFGYRSFLVFLSDTISGLKCIALSASLSESHSVDLAARTISSLWNTVGYPEDFQPSLEQFRQLVKACDGALAKSTFPQTVSLMLGPYRHSVGNNRLLEASDPQALAKVLNGLFEISTSTQAHITITGGAECGFVAALAQWLFDYKVLVEDERGETVFTSCKDDDQAQVRVVYQRPGADQTITITKSTYLLGAPRDLLRYMPDKRSRLIRCRVPWHSSLSYTFGQSFADLLELSSALGTFLGGAARIYRALAWGEDDSGGFSREHFVNFVPASYGQGFADNMTSLFTELGDVDLLDVMKVMLSRSVERTCKDLEEVFLTLERQCMCPHCRRAKENFKTPRKDAQLCLLALAMTLLELITLTSSISVEKDLLPTEIGLFRLYENNAKTFHGLKPRQPKAKLAKILRLEFEKDDFFTRVGKMTPAHLTAKVICMFTGFEISGTELETYNYRTAVAQNGICIYLDCLESMTTEPSLLRRVHVMPGHIAHGNKMFDSIWDCAPTKAPSLKRAEVKKIAGNEEVPQHDSQESLTISALVDEIEGAGQLALCYQITTSQGPVLIPPGMLTEFVLLKSGKIICSGLDCSRTFKTIPYAVLSGWKFDLDHIDDLGESTFDNKAVMIWNNGKADLNRLLAIELQRQSSFINRARASIFLRQSECLACAINTAYRSPKSENPAGTDRGSFLFMNLLHII